MKFVPHSRRRVLANIARAKSMRRVRSRLNRKRSRIIAALRPKDTIEVTTARGTTTATYSGRGVPLPETMCLDENYDATIEAISVFRTVFLDSHNQNFSMQTKDYPDFTTIKYLTPTVALMIGAELDRARRITGKRLRAINFSKWHPDVRKLVHALDFFSLVEISQKQPSIKSTSEGVYVVPIVSGELTSGSKAGTLTKLVSTMAKAICNENDPIYKRLQSVIIEGMENTALHAYEQRYQNDIPHTQMWWLTGGVDIPSRRLTVAIYDQGATIPVTLPFWTRFDRIRGFLSDILGRDYDPSSGSDDHRALEAAMAIGATTTGLPQHGKGLPEFKAFVDACPAAKVRIASRHGEYTYRKGVSPTVQWHQTALRGTLVEWDVFL